MKQIGLTIFVALMQGLIGAGSLADGAPHRIEQQADRADPREDPRPVWPSPHGDPSIYRPTHLVGTDVPPPKPGEAYLVGHHGDTMVLLWSQTVPSRKRAQDVLQIYYRYTLGDDTARVIRREALTGSAGDMPIGADGIASAHRGWRFYDGKDDPDREAAWKTYQEALGQERRILRHTYALSNGLLYQIAKEGDDARFGPLYYAPRDGKHYHIDKEIKLADEGFIDLGVDPSMNQYFQTSERFVVAINREKTAAQALDLTTGTVKSFALIAPKGSERWIGCDPLLGSRYLLAEHGLYDPATGERVAVREHESVYRYVDHKNRLMHDGVCYVIARPWPRKKNEDQPLRLLAFPAMGSAQQQREIHRVIPDPEMSDSFIMRFKMMTFFAGDKGLVYLKDNQWEKMDWLSIEDF